MNIVQQKELLVYKEIAKVCDKYALNYFAIGGTCIGAVRHRGFIPWDDDIDIALPREDYEAFRTKYYKELPPYLLKLDYDNSRQHSFLFTKIHDARTTFVESYAKNSTEKYTGAFVDLMPIDGLPDDAKERNATIKSFQKLDYLNNRCRPVPLSVYGGAVLGPFKFLARKIFGIFHDYNFYSTEVKKLGIKHNYNTAKYCIFTWRASTCALTIERIVFPKYFFDEIIEVPFENTVMKIPKMYDAYLKQDFGDYMRLPPVEQQKSVHNVYISDMNTPCSYYAKRDKEAYNNRYKFWR